MATTNVIAVFTDVLCFLLLSVIAVPVLAVLGIYASQVVLANTIFTITINVAGLTILAFRNNNSIGPLSSALRRGPVIAPTVLLIHPVVQIEEGRDSMLAKMRGKAVKIPMSIAARVFIIINSAGDADPTTSNTQVIIRAVLCCCLFGLGCIAGSRSLACFDETAVRGLMQYQNKQESQSTLCQIQNLEMQQLGLEQKWGEQERKMSDLMEGGKSAS